MNIILSGGWSYGNIGDEVICKVTMALIKQYFPDIPLNVTSYDTENFNYHHHMKVQDSLHKLMEINNIADAGKFEDIVINPEKYGLAGYINMFDKNTVLIMGGGGYFNCGKHTSTMFLSRILEIELAKKNGAKVIIIGQSIGPVQQETDRQLLKNALLKCDMVYVRDEFSREFIHELLPQKEVNVSADVALLISEFYKPQMLEKKINIMPAAYSKYRAIDGKQIVSGKIEHLLNRITLRYYRYEWKYKKLIKKIVNDKYKVRFVLSTDWEWDIAFVRRIIKTLPTDSYEIVNNLDVDSFCQYLCNGSLTISTKLHPIIVSTSYKVPCYAISYNFKVDGFMRSISKEKHCCRNDKMHVNKLYKQVSAFLNNGYNNYSYEQEQRKSIYLMMENLKINLNQMN